MKIKDIQDILKLMVELKIDIPEGTDIKLIEKLRSKYKTKNKVFWEATVYYDRREEKEMQGLIDKEDYDKIKKLLKKEPDYDICFGEITKHCYMYCFLKDIEFSSKQNDIISFYESNKSNDELMDYLDGAFDDII
jgi:hypothetical protein